MDGGVKETTSYVTTLLPWKKKEKIIRFNLKSDFMLNKKNKTSESGLNSRRVFSDNTKQDKADMTY